MPVNLVKGFRQPNESIKTTILFNEDTGEFAYPQSSERLEKSY